MRRICLVLILICLMATIYAETIQEEYVEGKTYNHSSAIEFSGYYHNSVSDSVILRFSWLTNSDYKYYLLLEDREITDEVDSNKFNNHGELLYWEMTGQASGSADIMSISFTITTMSYGSTYIPETIQFGVEYTTLDGYTSITTNRNNYTRSSYFYKSLTGVQEEITASEKFSNNYNLLTTQLSSSKPSVTYTLQYKFIDGSLLSYPSAGTIWTRTGIIKLTAKRDSVKNLPAGKYVGTISVEVTPP